ncbi:hypothetical protein HJFPF1_11187 [Paramyrothecium foliicola]|nr:hypothetical protein HJFPF1_11187 [Paramyrothecium foliicola]
MASFGRQFSGSPVLTMSPQHSLQTPLPRAHFPRRPSPRPFSSYPATQRTTSSVGRKRSRDEASANLESDAPMSQDDWTYGEGMVLIKAGPSYVPDASSQSGTWVDEKLSNTLDSQGSQVAEASQRSHKSQRLDRDASISPTSTPISETAAPFGVAVPPLGANGGPVVDDFTLQLGIGWRKISSDEHIQAAARGWARYIENHYPISNVRVSLESRGLQSYLVEANEGFFLFDENLRQGRLVSQDAQRALQHLQCTPPTFDGAITLSATESPRPVESPLATPSADTEMSL